MELFDKKGNKVKNTEVFMHLLSDFIRTHFPEKGHYDYLDFEIIKNDKVIVTALDLEDDGYDGHYISRGKCVNILPDGVI